MDVVYKFEGRFKEVDTVKRIDMYVVYCRVSIWRICGELNVLIFHCDHGDVNTPKCWRHRRILKLSRRCRLVLSRVSTLTPSREHVTGQCSAKPPSRR